jgi:hypothetical protein
MIAMCVVVLKLCWCFHDPLYYCVIDSFQISLISNSFALINERNETLLFSANKKKKEIIFESHFFYIRRYYVAKKENKIYIQIKSTQ